MKSTNTKFSPFSSVSHLKIVGVLSCLVEEICGFNKLRSQEVLTPVDLEICCHRLWDEVVPLHDLIEHLKNIWLIKGSEEIDCT